ncbi:MAG: penicillin acylase family protein [Chloroflexi bacterium]|nr:MAG: penicillin acylase family protein [Chloroflexota bacterium]
MSTAVPRAALVALLVLVVLPAPNVASAAVCTTVTPTVGPAYVDCAGGGVRNVLPPGENGLTNVIQFGRRQIPPHSQDQLDMYAKLVRFAPNIQATDIPSYFKSAPLGIDPGDVGAAETPRSGTLIVRDKSFGVPHIYGADRYGTEFGAGYAAAEDRLFMMDVLRHVGRSTASAFLGPSPATLALDCSTARVAGYNEAELQQQVDLLPQRYTAPFDATHTDGQQVQADGLAYIDGINAYIQAALVDPTKLPAEYPALQEVPTPWTSTDIIAVATLVQAIFAVGGGNEVDSALLYSSLTGRYGQAKGAAMWSDFRSQNDPQAVTTLSTPFPYMTGGTVNPAAVAMPTQSPTTDFCNGGPLPALSPGTGKISIGPVTVDLSPYLQPKHASNAILVAGSHTAAGHPIAVFGPQVSYFDPEILHEEDLHGPGFNARGASFPGTDVYVELGRGADYAWSATSAGSDIIDERLEKLCNPDGSPPTLKSTSYVYNGACTPMYERTDREVAKTSAGGPNPPQVITIQIERTVHGPVVGRTYAKDPQTGSTIPVAVSYQRSTFFDELGSAPAFLDWNSPDQVQSAADFMRAAAKETGTFNWFYADANDIAYYSSGKMPLRAAGVDPNFPSWGTGQWEWSGVLQADGSASDPHPHAVNPASGFLANWNNKPAPQWSAADSNFAYGPVYRSQSLSDRVAALVTRGGIQPVDMVNAMGDAGSVDLDGSQLVSQVRAVLQAPGAPLTSEQSAVLTLLGNWYSGGSHRRAVADPNAYDMGNAVAVMDAFYPRLAHAVFDPWLNSTQFDRLAGLNPLNDPPGAKGSAYDGGWEGYLQRSLRQAVNPTGGTNYSQSYCGSGKLQDCRQAVRAALQGAIDQLTAAYGSSDPAAWTCRRSNSASGQCNPARDDIVFAPVGVGSAPNIPWVNRPTWQQVVQYLAHR